MILPMIRKTKRLIAGAVLGYLLGSPAAIAAGLPVVRLTAGMHVIQAEVADNDASRMEGLMHRASMGQNNGMLFIFEDSQAHCMWMKNTLIALSVAFLDERGTILNIADMQPQTERTHCAARPARYALEMNRGWFEARGVKPGSAIRGIPQQAK